MRWSRNSVEFRDARVGDISLTPDVPASVV